MIQDMARITPAVAGSERQTSGLRVLGRTRLSRSTEESTSIERQRELITAWAQAHQHTIVGWAEDIDISGSVDPFQTPQLGEWLNNRADQFDVIACWKLDRITRSAIRLNTLIGWCLDHDKTLVSCTEGIDIGTPVGRLIANVIGFLAEGERDAIRERTTASHKKLRELGRWPGGKPSYGFQAVQTPDGWKLDLNPETAFVMRQIVADVLDGSSVESIAARLTADGVKSPSGKGLWRSQTIRQLLRSKTLLGHVTHDGVTVRDSSGDPVLKGPPLITPEEFDRVQAALDERSFTKTRTDKASPLLGLVKCMRCNGNLHHRRQMVGGKPYSYYYCRTCKGKQTRSEVLGALFEKTYLKQYGDKPLQEHVYIPASEHQTALEDAVRALDELTALAGTLTSKTAKDRLQSQIEAIDERISRLEQLPTEPARWEWRNTDQTHAEAWTESDPDERRRLLLKSGIVGYTTWVDGKLALVITDGSEGSE